MTYKSPVYNVIAVPIEKIVPNTYNPNAVAPPEMKLLYDSIKEDGYTMPIVCYYVKSQDIYVIVDGFHRYRIMIDHPDIYRREGGMLPVSVIDKPIEHRMASTIRHNRARGSHDVDLMSNIVKELHELGRSDAWIGEHLGMDKDEIIEISRKIDTFDISIEPFEDCCTVFTPKHPKTRPELQKVIDAESVLDIDGLVERAVQSAQFMMID
jgi:ParB-like chromosome segregation protein Spo0J